MEGKESNADQNPPLILLTNLVPMGGMAKAKFDITISLCGTLGIIFNVSLSYVALNWADMFPFKSD